MKQSLSFPEYERSVHRWGRFSIVLGLLIMLAVPTAVSVYYDAWPPLTPVLKGLLGVLPVFGTVGVIEAFTFAPMLGSGGSYLSFITGNLTALKVPCALNAMESAGVKPATPEGEVISTIAVAASAITTTIVLALGVLLLGQLTPLITSPLMQPVFGNILPALFGALAVVYIAKNPRLAITPLVLMTTLFLLMPSLASSVGVLVPVGALVTIGAARILYQKKLI